MRQPRLPERVRCNRRSGMHCSGRAFALCLPLLPTTRRGMPMTAATLHQQLVYRMDMTSESISAQHGVLASGDMTGVSAGGGRGPGETMEVPTLTVLCSEDARPLMSSSSTMAAARSQYLLESPCPGPGPAE